MMETTSQGGSLLSARKRGVGRGSWKGCEQQTLQRRFLRLTCATQDSVRLNSSFARNISQTRHARLSFAVRNLSQNLFVVCLPTFWHFWNLRVFRSIAIAIYIHNAARSSIAIRSPPESKK